MIFRLNLDELPAGVQLQFFRRRLIQTKKPSPEPRSGKAAGSGTGGISAGSGTGGIIAENATSPIPQPR
jgi:hypothetical protein